MRHTLHPNCTVHSLMRGLLPITPLSLYVWRANWQTIFLTSVNGCLPRLHSWSNTLGHIVPNPLSAVSKTGGSPPANQPTIQPALRPDIPELTGLAGCIVIAYSRSDTYVDSIKVRLLWRNGRARRVNRTPSDQPTSGNSPQAQDAAQTNPSRGLQCSNEMAAVLMAVF